MNRPTPTLLIGIDSTGVEVVATVRRRLTETIEPLTAACRFLAAAGNGTESGQSFDLCVDWPEDDGDAASRLSEEVREHVQTFLYSAELRALPEAQLDSIAIVFVATATEVSPARLLLPLANLIRSTCDSAIAGLSIEVEALIILPTGACSEGERVGNLVRSLPAATGHNSTFDRVFLVSSDNTMSNPSGLRLSPADTISLCAEFLLMRIATELVQHVRTVNVGTANTRMSAFGLSRIRFDAGRIARRLAVDTARKIVSNGIVVPDPRGEEARKRAREFASANSLDANGFASLNNDLSEIRRGGTVHRIEDELSVTAFTFHRVKREGWPDMLATFDAFFRHERFGKVMLALEGNRVDLLNRLLASIRSAVDREIQQSRDPNNTLAFLHELNSEIDELRKRAKTTHSVINKSKAANSNAGDKSLEAEDDSPKELEPRLRELETAIKEEPSRSAVFVRSFLLALVIALPLDALLERIGILPKPIQWLPALCIGAIIPFVAAYKMVQKADSRIQNLAEGCTIVIEASYRRRLLDKIDSTISSLLDTLYLLTLNTKELQQAHPNYAGGNECGVVERFDRLLKENLVGALHDVPEEALPGWSLDAATVAVAPPEYDYRDQRGFADWTGEADRLVEEGMFSGWRTTAASELAAKAFAHAVRGYDHLQRISLDNFARSHLFPPQDSSNHMVRLYNRLFAMSQPLIQAGREEMAVIGHPLCVCAKPNDNWIAAQIERHATLAARIEGPSREDFALIQLAVNIPVEHLLAASSWNQSKD